MSEISIQDLNKMFASEYARFTFLNQYEKYEEEEEEEEEEECSTTCCDNECNDNNCNEDLENNLCDPNEYALYFSTLRLVIYFQNILEKSYSLDTKLFDYEFESIMKWALSKKYLSNENEIESLAILFTFIHETMSIIPSKDLVCYTQDYQRIPLLYGENLTEPIEILSKIVQKLNSEK